MAKRKNPFVKHCLPANSMQSAGTVCQMEYAWDKAIEQAILSVRTSDNLNKAVQRLCRLRSTKQRNG